MKRSVIQLAGKTHVISLPSKWVKKYNIKKGDELEITEENSFLKVNCSSQIISKKISVNISDFNAGLVWHTILSLYKDSYDEVDVYFENIKTKYEKSGEIVLVLHLLQDITDYCMGMEIVKQGKHSCVIKEVGNLKAEEFNILFRRMHFSIINLLEDGINAMHSKDYELLKTLTEHSEKSINKISYTCIRTFNKTGTLPSSLLILVYNIENIGDCITRIFNSIARKKSKDNTQLLVLLENSKELFLRYNNLFYKPELNEINKMHSDILKMMAKLDNVQAKSMEEYSYLHNLLNFMFYLTDSIGAGMPSNLQYKG